MKLEGAEHVAATEFGAGAEPDGITGVRCAASRGLAEQLLGAYHPRSPYRGHWDAARRTTRGISPPDAPGRP